MNGMERVPFRRNGKTTVYVPPKYNNIMYVQMRRAGYVHLIASSQY